MPTRPDRRALAAAWKERTPLAGAYAIRCRASGGAWVGASPDLPAVENRMAFTLRMGKPPHAAMAEAFRAHGPEAFEVEFLETLPADAEDIARKRLLREMRDAWAAKLSAKTI